MLPPTMDDERERPPQIPVIAAFHPSAGQSGANAAPADFLLDRGHDVTRRLRRRHVETAAGRDRFAPLGGRRHRHSWAALAAETVALVQNTTAAASPAPAGVLA